MTAENPFISPKHLFLFSRYSRFCVNFIGHATKWLDKKDILSSKGNQTMKFGQLIECNMINTFFQKPYTKCDAETSPGLSSKKLKLSISLDQ